MTALESNEMGGRTPQTSESKLGKIHIHPIPTSLLPPAPALRQSPVLQPAGE